MTEKIRKSILATAVLALSVSTAIGIQTTFASAETAPQISMVSGASVRIVDTEANVGNGMRFSMQMDKTEYETMMSDTRYTDVKFGIIIVPNEAEYKDISYETVFGTDGEYAYAVWADSDKDGVYAWEYDKEANAGKTRIMNFSYDVMYDSSDALFENPNNVYVRGTITDLNPGNEVREFQGIGYVTYKYENVQKNVFLAPELRSMTHVAQLLVERDYEDSETLQEYYIDPFARNGASATETSFTQEYYLHKDGAYVLDETSGGVVSQYNGDKIYINDSVELEQKKIDGYIFDTNNENNLLSGKAYANGKLTLKGYYLGADDVISIGTVEETVWVGETYTLPVTFAHTDSLSATSVKAYHKSTNREVEIDGENGTYAFNPETYGDYYVEVTATDTLGSSVTKTADFYVAGYDSEAQIYNPTNFKTDGITLRNVENGASATATYYAKDTTDGAAYTGGYIAVRNDAVTNGASNWVAVKLNTRTLAKERYGERKTDYNALKIWVKLSTSDSAQNAAYVALFEGGTAKTAVKYGAWEQITVPLAYFENYATDLLNGSKYVFAFRFNYNQGVGDNQKYLTEFCIGSIELAEVDFSTLTVYDPTVFGLTGVRIENASGANAGSGSNLPSAYYEADENREGAYKGGYVSVTATSTAGISTVRVYNMYGMINAMKDCGNYTKVKIWVKLSTTDENPTTAKLPWCAGFNNIGSEITFNEWTQVEISLSDWTAKQTSDVWFTALYLNQTSNGWYGNTLTEFCLGSIELA